jgi:hypothetical protein
MTENRLRIFFFVSMILGTTILRLLMQQTSYCILSCILYPSFPIIIGNLNDIQLTRHNGEEEISSLRGRLYRVLELSANRFASLRIAPDALQHRAPQIWNKIVLMKFLLIVTLAFIALD